MSVISEWLFRSLQRPFDGFSITHFTVEFPIRVILYALHDFGQFPRRIPQFIQDKKAFHLPDVNASRLFLLFIGNDGEPDFRIIQLIRLPETASLRRMSVFHRR
jgi:hypothetical protein